MTKNIHGIIGVVILISAEVLMLKKIEPFATWFYSLAWWSYILIVDSIIYKKKGNSLILSRTGSFLVMILWSVFIWLIFEWFNLTLSNWHYIDIPDTLWIRWFGYALAYSTVLPGLFETEELLDTLGLFKKRTFFAIPETTRWYLPFLIIGAVFFITPLLWPRYCFPLVWGAFIFLLEPANHRFGGPSLMREWERGNLRKFFLLLTAGLVCGLLWEFWNFWAGAKWVYTIPYFNKPKLFEMPLAGFLGFPPFAVECYVMFSFISLFRNKRGWEENDHNLFPDRKTLLWVKVFAVLLIAAFYWYMFWAIDEYTIVSWKRI
ncbi:MAG: hypothetical protein JRE23_05190 [Deltaproteobacteria bacterium]|nr:hypothetical protein [Deltaproteobacteria bacterium]